MSMSDTEYCDYCERVGHTFRSCPRRDDELEPEELTEEELEELGRWDAPQS